MNEYRSPTYRVWLIIFAIVFLLSFLSGILGVRAIISIIIRNPEIMNTELYTVIRSGIIALMDGTLLVVATILLIRATLTRSTYQVWLLIIAIGFMLKFALGLIAGISAFNILSRYDFAHHKVDYYYLIGVSIITLIYGVFAVVAITLSRRMAFKS